MAQRKGLREWVCIQCSHVLGHVLGGEFQPREDLLGKYLITRGPNLVVTCDECGTRKVWYTSDQTVRAVNQMIDAFASVAVARMIRDFTSRSERQNKINLDE